MGLPDQYRRKMRQRSGVLTSPADVQGGTNVGRLNAAVVCVAAVLLGPSGLQAGDAVLVEFTSQQCGPCRAMQPIIAQLAASGVAVRRVDVDREPGLVQRYSIKQTPTFLVLSGGKELTRMVGMQTAAQLQSALAINPAGPWKQTNATATANVPQTRLAPLPTAMPAPSDPPSLATMPRSEAMPSVAHADAVERAQAATVRLRVFDASGHGVGTGTIIDTHGDEALVLTCGHLFRDTQGQGRIEVDLFVGGKSQTIAGQLIDYDADDRDIALVAIRPGFPIQPVPVIRHGRLPEVGSTAFSFGCDRGADPSRRDTRITGVNKYNQHKAASNLEIAGAPIDGRSGGGLFDAEGFLIGVCNAADFQGDIGIYAGPGAIHWQLDRLQLARLYRNDVPAAVQPAAQPVAQQPPADRFASLDGPSAGGWSPEPAAPAATSPAATSPAAAAPVAQEAADQEVIVIIRDRVNPEATSRVMTLARPSGELLRMLESQAAR